MKKIFIFNDTHGNAESIKALLPKINEINPDYIFSSGDLIGIGPSHNEVLDIVSKLPNFYSVKGNHEAYYLDGYRNPLAALQEDHHNWIRSSMDEKHHEFLQSLPYVRYFDIEELKVALIHYPRVNNRFITIEEDKSYDKLCNIFSSIEFNLYKYSNAFSYSFFSVYIFPIFKLASKSFGTSFKHSLYNSIDFSYSFS